MDRRSRACSGVSARRYGGVPTWQVAHDVARRHVQPKTVLLSLFQNEFSQFFQIEVLQTLNTKVVKQVALFNNAKGSIGFYSLV
jgi:hypothetical protein